MNTAKYPRAVTWFAALAFFATQITFSGSSWAKYIYFSSFMLVFVVDIIEDRFDYRVSLTPFFIFMFSFSSYILLSSLWAINPSNSIHIGTAVMEIFISMFVFYNHFSRYDDGVEQLLSIIRWAGYYSSVYFIIFYGKEYVITRLIEGERAGEVYANTYGMIGAIAILLQCDNCLLKKSKPITFLLCVPALIIILATQSRKALLILIAGPFLSIYFRYIRYKDHVFRLVLLTLFLIFSVVFFVIMTKIDLFKAILERFGYAWATFIGQGKTDSGTQVRKDMIELGIQIFKESPLFGIGIGCTHIRCAEALARDTYLHNNFVELLAGGGIFGFLVYYSSFVYLIGKLIRLRHFQTNLYPICCILLIVLLFKDFAAVSYYNKTTYFYFLVFFLYVEKLTLVEENELINFTVV